DERVAPAIIEGLDSTAGMSTSGLREHLDRAVALLDGEVGLGAMPSDLLEMLADLALAGPGTCAARALSRGRPELGAGTHEVRVAASAIAGAVRSVFNARDVTTMLRAHSGGETTDEAYWRLVLHYAVDGCLQAVFDEWVHVLVDAYGLRDAEPHDVLTELAATMRQGMTVQAVNYGVQDVRWGEDGVSVTSERLRGHFALRFGDERSETDQTVQRASSVRVAFNSPFRPFVLATTSVGQEGLDFHTYCHAVVHWNLPRNPVDLEQREGRVHRYKNHAVRRNLAGAQRRAALQSDGDPWEEMFEAAARERDPDMNELFPYWIYPNGDARIERYVPALPLSREAQRREELRRSTADYRLVFGQPRQDDLLAYLDGRAAGEDLEEFRIDLNPPTGG
ncbi:MAG: helicase-related protein, partial [Dehalococcoidia bacterium]